VRRLGENYTIIAIDSQTVQASLVIKRDRTSVNRIKVILYRVSHQFQSFISSSSNIL